MITIEVRADAVNRRLDELAARMAALPQRMATELSAWEIEDVHRRYPETVASPKAVATVIPRRSRKPSKWKRPQRFRFTQQGRRHPATPLPRSHLGLRRGTQAPILRPALFDKLCERMRALLLKTMNG